MNTLLSFPFASMGRRLRQAGVIGINARNSEYILQVNPRNRYQLVDNKLETKKLAAREGLAIPELFGVIRHNAETKDLASIIGSHQQFVVKPAAGGGGNGILVFKERTGDLFRLASRRTMTLDDIAFHIRNILAGSHSLSGQPDVALIESCVNFDPVFENITYRGVPDIRIIAYKGVPAMAMLRLPTFESDGRSNLHQDAIGAGIDLATGRTLNAVYRNRIVDQHPDTLQPVAGLEIPHFAQMIETAARCNAMTGLGYVGADIVIDRDRGPLLLELNARPGLAIQIANKAGLGARLRTTDESRVHDLYEEERIAFAKRTFAAGKQRQAA